MMTRSKTRRNELEQRLRRVLLLGVASAWRVLTVLIVVVDDRLDERAVAVKKQLHSVGDGAHAVEAVGYKLFGRDSTVGDERCHALHEQPAATAADAFNGFVAVSEPPRCRVDGDVLATKESRQIHQRAARLQHAEPRANGVFVAAADHHRVHRSTVRLHDAVLPALLVVVDAVGGAVLAGNVEAYLSRSDGEHASRAGQHASTYRHKPDGPYSDNRDALPKCQPQLFDAAERRAHHVGHHDGLVYRHVLGNVRQVHVGVSDVVGFDERPSTVSVVDAPIHVVRRGIGVAVLSLEASPVRHDSARDDAIAHLEVLDVGTDRHHFAAHLVPHRLAFEVGQRSRLGLQQMRVARAWRPDERAHERTRRARFIGKRAGAGQLEPVLSRQHCSVYGLHGNGSPFSGLWSSFRGLARSGLASKRAEH